MQANEAASTQEDAPKISVIVPVYNMEDKVSSALDSVLTQDIQDIEVICINDGSTDGSETVLAQYASHDSRVKVLQQANAGSGPARNSGLRIAKGEFIAFLDPDDWLPSTDVYSELYRCAKEHSAVLAAGNMMRFTEAGQPREVDKRKCFASETELRFSDTEDCFGYTRYIFNRKLLVDNDIYFPSYRRGQDPIFMTRVMDASDCYWVIPKTVYCYRFGTNHIKWTPAKLVDHCMAFQEVLTYSKRKSYKSMHSVAASWLLNRKFIVLSYSFPDENDLLSTFKRALGSIDKNLLNSTKQYTSILSMVESFDKAYRTRGKVLKGKVVALKVRLLVRGIVAGIAWKLFPNTAVKLKEKRLVPSGNSGTFD